jgi:hypothetical protein
MKKLVLLFVLIKFNSFSQLVYMGNAISHSENKELSQFVFNYFNDYRNSIGLADFVWNDVAYTSAKTWNSILAKNNLYGHSGDISDQTLYNYSSSNDYEIINGTITNESYSGTEFQNRIIADSMLQKFLKSPYHEPVLCSEVKTAEQSYSKIKKNVYGGGFLQLAKYAAVSVVVKNMGDYTQYILIMHLYIEKP